MLIHVERLDSLGEGEVLKTRKGAGGFFFLSNTTRSPKLAAKLVRGGSLVLCSVLCSDLTAIMVSRSFLLKLSKKKHALF